MLNLGSKIEEIFSNENYVFSEKDVDPFVLNYNSLFCFVSRLSKTLCYYRTREHLLFFRYFVKRVDWTKVVVLDKKIIHLLHSLNYTVPYSEQSVDGLSNTPYNPMRVLIQTPQLLNQKTRRYSFKDSSNYFVGCDSFPWEFLSGNCLDLYLIVKKIYRVIKDNVSEESSFVVLYSFLQKMTDLEDQNKTEYSFNKVWGFLEKEIKGEMFLSRQAFVDYSLDRYSMDGRRSITERLLVNKFREEVVVYLKKRRPVFFFFDDLVQRINLKKLLFLGLKNSCFGGFFKENGSIKKEKVFFKVAFGVSSSKVINLLKNTKDIKDDDLVVYLENILILGYFFKKFNISHGNFQRLMALAKKGDDEGLAIFGSMLGTSDISVFDLPFLNGFSEKKILSFLENTSEELNGEINVDDLVLNSIGIYEDIKDHLDKTMKVTDFSDYNSIGKLNSLFNREFNRTEHSEFSLYYNKGSIPFLEIIPEKMGSYDFRLAKNSEELLNWGFKLRNCLGSYVCDSSTVKHIHGDLIFGLLENNEIKYALELSFHGYRNFKNTFSYQEKWLKESLKFYELTKAEQDRKIFNRRRASASLCLKNYLKQIERFFSFVQVKGLYNRDLSEEERIKLNKFIDKIEEKCFKLNKREFRKQIQDIFKKYPLIKKPIKP